MKKRMFSRFTNILHQAVEALAPQLSLQDEFIFHWRAVTNYFMDNKGDKIPIDQTDIPTHLDQMVILLQEEDRTSDKDSTGPCMEYLLQHKLLETLYSLGRTDHPPGMKQVVLQVFTKLLSRLKQPLLAHVSVHRAVHRMVKACGEVKAAPSEIEEIQFLCTVCSIIKSHPHFVNFFIDVPKNKMTAVKTSNAKEKSPKSETRSEEAAEKTKQEFSLITSLLSLSHSADSRVAVKACEGMMLCASLPEESAAKCIVQDTQFCTELSQRLVEAYLKLPAFVNPIDLETVEAKWGLDVITESEDQQTFLGKRHLVSFLSWLDYCDQLISVANPMIAKCLACCIKELFLEVIMEPSILQTSESGAILATAYLTRCLRTVCSPQLLSEFCHFVLGDGKAVEISGEESHRIRQRLIERCDHLSEEVCLVTLKLFDTLLQKDDEHIMHNLVLRNLVGRSYYKTTPDLTEVETEVQVNAKDETTNEPVTDETQSRTEESQTSTSISSSSQSQATSPNQSQTVSPSQSETTSPSQSQTVSPGQSQTSPSQSQTTSPSHSQTTSPSQSQTTSPSQSQTTSPNHGRTEVHKVVNSFLSLLPEELKSSYQTADSGYDMYLRDAHKQFNDIKTMCEPWSWPKQAVSLQQFYTEEFYEGSFLKMILDKFSHLMDQSYAINLQLTSVLSKLALIPHPNVQEFLLDPFLPVKDGTRTLFHIFQKISSEIRIKLNSESDLSHRLVLARKQLMSNNPNLRRLHGQKQLEAIIIMEEFCKELAAIAFVKHHTALTQS